MKRLYFGFLFFDTPASFAPCSIWYGLMGLKMNRMLGFVNSPSTVIVVETLGVWSQAIQKYLIYLCKYGLGVDAKFSFDFVSHSPKTVDHAGQKVEKGG